MIVETLFVGRDNTMSLRLLRGGVPVNIVGIVTGYALHWPDGRVFNEPSRFVPKKDGVVEISIGDILTLDDVGSRKAHLVTYDAINVHGVRWPDFKLKVRV